MADGGGRGAAGHSSIPSGDRADNSRSSSAPLDGAFLLQLLRNPPQSQPQPRPQPHQKRPQQHPPSPLPFLSHETLNPHRDPAVAAVGPTYPFAPHTFIRPQIHQHRQDPSLHLPSPPILPSSSPSSSFPPGFSRGQWAPPGFSGSPPAFRGDFIRNSPPSHQTHHHYNQHHQHHHRDNSIGTGGGGRSLDSRARGRGRGHAGGNLAAEESGAIAFRPKSNSMTTMHPQVPFDRNHPHPHHPSASPGNHHNAMSAAHMHGMGEQRMPRPTAVRSQRPVVSDWGPSNTRRGIKHAINDDDNNVHMRGCNHREGNGGPSSLKREFLIRQGGERTDVQQVPQNSRRVDRSEFGVMGKNYGSGLSGEWGRGGIVEERGDFGSGKSGSRDFDDLADQLEESTLLDEDTQEKNHVVKHSNSSRGKDVRIDLFRGHCVSSQRVRIRKRELECRYDIDSQTPLFLAIYRSLIPADEEKFKQKQLVLSLEKLVNKEWPNAQLHLYGSCANSFGVSNSDIDICLAIDDTNMSKSEILLKLAEILESDNLQDVQALTHARVPIVKLKDRVTGISCDICINNLLAVTNTNLLRHYAQIDDRLRQLAFIVKHWAKSRGVNETYRGTLSSYAYVLMCIHFLQQRKPAILPCLQGMEPTYIVNVDGIQCAYFDQVDRLRSFGAQNNESIARLLWGFFHYWAYYHDYTNDVISVRAGRNISKRVKDWTRRIGNDRHLICIEDPFETSHDLGRVVDKFSIKILREEFERAADILQYDANPSVTLFEPYVHRSLPDGLQPDKMQDDV